MLSYLMDFRAHVITSWGALSSAWTRQWRVSQDRVLDLLELKWTYQVKAEQKRSKRANEK